MQINRSLAQAPRTRDVAEAITRIEGPCIGCKECSGLCAALIEALTLPDVLVGRQAARG